MGKPLVRFNVITLCHGFIGFRKRVVEEQRSAISDTAVSALKQALVLIKFQLAAAL